MPAPVTVTEFLELLPKSGVLEPDRLDTYVQGLSSNGVLPPAPSQVGELMVRDGLLTQFQLQQLLLGKYLGFTIGNYQILELLGSGGMSAVYLCRHRERGHRVAVKVLPKQLAKDPTLLKRFYREARASAALHHPNIVRGYEADNERNQHFMVMEFVDGASLQEIVRKHGPLDVNRAAHYIRQAAIGLQYASEQGMVHRDIKPGNLLVDRSGAVKILDMGLSRFYNEEESVLTKDVLGTIDYLAPEQARDSHGVDIRADIYSLGGTFYFLLTGNAPFGPGLDPQSIAQRMQGPPSVLNSRPEVPEALAALLTKMLAHQPEDRYQTPKAVADALAPWTKTPVPPPPEGEMPRFSAAARGTGESPTATASLFYKLTRGRRDRKWLLIGALCVLAVAAGVAAWLTVGQGP